MRIVSTNEFRGKLADYLENVAKNDTPLIVSRFGKPLAKVVPYKKEEENIEKFFGFMGSDVDGVTYLKRIRRSKKEKDYIEKLRNG